MAVEPDAISASADESHVTLMARAVQEIAPFAYMTACPPIGFGLLHEASEKVCRPSERSKSSSSMNGEMELYVMSGRFRTPP